MKGKGKYFFGAIREKCHNILNCIGYLSIFKEIQITFCGKYLSVLVLDTVHGWGGLLEYLIKIIGYVLEQSVCTNFIGK